MNNSFVKLTLANGGCSTIIRKEHVAFAMRLQKTEENGKSYEFTRIIPKDITIDAETNWLDVVETPEDILKMMR